MFLQNIKDIVELLSCVVLAFRRRGIHFHAFKKVLRLVLL